MINTTLITDTKTSNTTANNISNDDNNMKKIKELVSLISGNRTRECYYILCLAVNIALSYQPSEPQMKLLCMEVGKKSGKTALSIEKSVSRVTDDIWNNGNRDNLNRLFNNKLLKKPKPKNLIYTISEHVWINSNTDTNI